MPLFFGILLLVIGVLLVFGLFDVSIFSTIFENFFYLWPFILILIGLSILSKIKGLRWLRFINAIFIICFALALIFYPTDFLSDKIYEEYQFQVALDETADINILELDVPTVYLEVVSDNNIQNMIIGTYYSNVDDTDIRVSGNRVRITRKDDNKFFLFVKPKYELHLRIPQQANLELLIDSAVLKGDIILEKNTLEIIDINTAILNLELTVKDFSIPLEIICESAINNLDIIAPADIRYTKTMKSAINKISVDDVFKEVDYEADLEVEVSSAINNFNLKTYVE
ncbi:MAG: hypothetical protein U9N62_10425 [Thermotogota bacterium]|nr:hypothetical protein [Thermotogota bacterium]